MRGFMLMFSFDFAAAILVIIAIIILDIIGLNKNSAFCRV